MTRTVAPVTAAVAVLVALLAGCSSDDTTVPLLAADDPVEGVLDTVPARLDAVGLAGPTELEGGDACVTAVTVHPGGRTNDGPRWLVTFDLAAVPADRQELAATLGEEGCLELHRSELERIVAALGAIGPDALDVTHLDPDGRRWLDD